MDLIKLCTSMRRYSWLSLGFLPFSAQAEEAPYTGSRYQEVWDQVSSDPYGGLPQYEVTLHSFFNGLRNMIFESSVRTLNTQSDLLPYFDKLVHPNGICMAGTWNITEANPYTGAYRVGTKARIIVRASTALTNTKSSQNRAFGLAGKIYPTDDAAHPEPLKTANFFTIENLGGTRRPYFMDAENTNDIILINPTLTAFFNSLEGLTVAQAFTSAEGSNLQTALIRELYPIAELYGESPDASKAPIWMKIQGASDMPRIEAEDFREELNIKNYSNGITFDIFVASKGSRFGKKDWQKIGFIQIDETVVSESCDHRLHFAHPKARKKY